MATSETAVVLARATEVAEKPLSERDRTKDEATAAGTAPPVLAPAAPTQLTRTSIPGEHVTGENDSFDSVMTRITAMIDRASPSGLRTDVTERRPGVETPEEWDSRITPEDHVPGPPPDIASKAAQFLAESSPAPGSVPAADSVAAPEARSEQDRVSPVDAVAEALRCAGLGDELLQVVSEARHRFSLEAALVQAFSTVPAAPALPRSPGSLLVVVGAGGPARRLAAALAGEMGVDPAGIPLASLDPGAYTFATGPLLVRSAEEGAERAPGWRRSKPAVVVVDACVTGAHRSWATHVIGALRPTVVWGVVDATSKTEDIGAWAEALGGIDALALENVDATVSPASALSVGLPVARLDGQPATATRWAAALVDRIGPNSKGVLISWWPAT
jgi:hypothetical protein